MLASTESLLKTTLDFCGAYLILREFFSGIKRGQQGWHFCLSPAQKGHFCMALFLLNRGFYAKMHTDEYLCNKNEEKIYRF